MLTSLGQVLPAAAAKYGDKTALIADDKTFSFRELDQLSNALAISLTKLGVAPGDRVTLYATNSWEWLVSYYGVLKTGAVINPINVMLTPAEVGYVTRDCGAKVLIGSRDKVAAVLAASAGCSTNIVFGADTPSGALPFGRSSSAAMRASNRCRLLPSSYRRSAIRREPPVIPRARCSRIAQ